MHAAVCFLTAGAKGDPTRALRYISHHHRHSSCLVSSESLTTRINKEMARCQNHALMIADPVLSASALSATPRFARPSSGARARSRPS